MDIPSTTRQDAPRVTAIVSLFRAERFVRCCLEDLIAQTLFQRGELEIVVIDSASPEGEWAIVSEYVSRYPSSVRAIRTEEREGLYAAWNRGIALARGQYLTNANADDRHRNDALEILARTLDSNPDAALAYADCLVTFRENETMGDHVRAGFLRRPDWTPEILSEGCHMGPQPMWRRSVHEQIGGFDESYRSAGDYEFWCRMATAGMAMVHVPDFLGLYQENPAGICNADPTLGEVETRRVRESCQAKLPPATQSWIDNRVYPVADPEEFVHLMVRAVGPLPRIEKLMAALADLTVFPHKLTVVVPALTAATKGFFAALQHRGIVHRILIEPHFSPDDLMQRGACLEPKAMWQVLLGSDVIPLRRNWLVKIVRPCGYPRKGKTILASKTIVDLSIFPNCGKLEKHPCTRPLLWLHSRLPGRKRTLEVAEAHGIGPLSLSFPPPPSCGKGPYLPLQAEAFDDAFVHIVMISYNRLDFTRQSIESLHRTANFPYKLTVVDNSSTDGSREWLESAAAMGHITRLCALQENVGVARAANLGWTLEPSSPWFLKLDNDMVMQKEDWLGSMVDILESDPGVALVAANVEPSSYPLDPAGHQKYRTKHGTLGGACVMVPQRTHDLLGYWSEAYGKYGEEDFDYGFRTLFTGLRNVYLADEDIAFHLPAGKAASIEYESFVAKDGKEEELHRAYRQEKDAQRLQNHKTGYVQKRLLAYIAGTEPLFQHTQARGNAHPSEPPPTAWDGSLLELSRQVEEDRSALPRPGILARTASRLGFGTL